MKGRGRALEVLAMAVGAGVAIGGRLPAGAQSPLALYEQARERLDAIKAGDERALAASLDDPNPYQRLLTLRRLADQVGPVEPLVASALLRRLEEREPLQSEECLRLYQELRSPLNGVVSQADDQLRASCEYSGGVANGTLAGQLLQRAPAEHFLPEVAALLVRRPAQTGAVLASLGPLTARAAPEALRLLASEHQPDAQAALLGLAAAGEESSVTMPNVLAPAVALLDARSPDLKRQAALVLLRLSACRRSEPLHDAQSRAADQLKASLADLSDRQIVADVGRLGRAGAPFVRPLLARFARGKQEQLAVLQALAGLGPGAAGAQPLLARLLRDRRAYLHEPALQALSEIGPAARDAKTAIMALARTDIGRRTRMLAYQALARTGARLNGGEFASLKRRYRRDCADANSNAFISLSRDDQCADSASALAELARRGGFRFEDVSEY